MNSLQEVASIEITHYRAEGVVKSKTYQEETDEYRIEISVPDGETRIVLIAPPETAVSFYNEQVILMTVTLEPTNDQV